MELNQACVPLLQKSTDPKVVIVTSTMGSITMAESMPLPIGATVSPYRASKAAINMMLVEWVHWVKGVRFWGVCPGLCATEFAGDFTKNNGRDPREAGEIVRQCIEGERDDLVGKMIYEQNGESGVRPW